MESINQLTGKNGNIKDKIEQSFLKQNTKF